MIYDIMVARLLSVMPWFYVALAAGGMPMSRMAAGAPRTAEAVILRAGQPASWVIRLMNKYGALRRQVGEAP